jgi:hypothetical protein
MLARAWQGQRVGGEPGAGSPDRIQRVVLTAQPPLATGLAADLEQPLALRSTEASQTSAVITGALDRPETNATRVPVREAERGGVAASARLHPSLRDHRSPGSGHDRDRVLIAVRVDTDHLVQLVCKHPDRSSVCS